MISGSNAHTSPLAPLNKHFESQPRIPIRRVNESDQTDPPESKERARVGRDVHRTFRTPALGEMDSVSVRITSPVIVLIIKIAPRLNPASNLESSELNDKALTAPCCFFCPSKLHHRSVCVLSKARMKPCDVPTATILETATAEAKPASVRS